MDDEDLNIDEQPPTGTGYDDGFPSPQGPSSRAPHDWAEVEALALVEADLALEEHRVGELARAERERDVESPRRRQ